MVACPAECEEEAQMQKQIRCVWPMLVFSFIGGADDLLRGTPTGAGLEEKTQKRTLVFSFIGGADDLLRGTPAGAGLEEKTQKRTVLLARFMYWDGFCGSSQDMPTSCPVEGSSASKEDVEGRRLQHCRRKSSSLQEPHVNLAEAERPASASALSC